MTQLDDLTAALTAVQASLTQLGADVGGVSTDVGTVAAEVQTLITMLGQPPVDLSAAIAQAQSIASGLSSIDTQVTGIDATLKSIPPAPTPSA